MAFTQIEAAGITSTSTVVLQNVTVAGVITATSGFSGNVTGNTTGTHIGNVTAGTITVNSSTNSITGVTSVSDASGGYLSNPPGTIITIAASTAPAGYLKANGASLSTTTYASLFSTIGYTFGGSGASFTLPDLRGEFIRGWADDRAVDTGRTFGSSQTDDFKSHTHNLRMGGSLYYAAVTDLVVRTDTFVGNQNTGATGGTETRPRNIALLYCIKY